MSFIINRYEQIRSNAEAWELSHPVEWDWEKIKKEFNLKHFSGVAGLDYSISVRRSINLEEMKDRIIAEAVKKYGRREEDIFYNKKQKTLIIAFGPNYIALEKDRIRVHRDGRPLQNEINFLDWVVESFYSLKN